MAKHILSGDENSTFDPKNIVVGDTIEVVNWEPTFDSEAINCAVEVISVYHCDGANTNYFGVLHEGKEKIFTPFGFYEKEV